MPRIKQYNEVDCPDRGQRWDTTPCLCDCHYRGGAPCGDIDKTSQPTHLKVSRRRHDWR